MSNQWVVEMGLNLMLEPRRERTTMSLEGILANCLKAENCQRSQRKYSWERGPDRGVMKMECEV